MLFVALLTTKPESTFQEGGARRLQWSYPEGMNVLAEYWLETDSPRVVSVFEAESMEPMGQIRMQWGDLFEIEVFPAVTGEQGMQMLRQAMAQQQA
jgi:hypothetical protein